MDVFERLGLGRLIDSSLGKRGTSWNAFRYSEMNDSRYRLVVQRSPKKEDGEVVTDMSSAFLPNGSGPDEETYSSYIRGDGTTRKYSVPDASTAYWLLA